MFYSSGTTGRPKGIVPPGRGEIGTPLVHRCCSRVSSASAEARYLSPAPLYHAAPPGCTTTCRLGETTFVMEHSMPWSSCAVEHHRVTHVQFVPTHLVRLLKLACGGPRRYDLSSLQKVVHAAAPCPAEVKRAAIEWMGPDVHEYYSGSEGKGFCVIGPEEWLAHPDSVGSLSGRTTCGRPATSWPRARRARSASSRPRFEYHGDPRRRRPRGRRSGLEHPRRHRLGRRGGLPAPHRPGSNMIISGGREHLSPGDRRLLVGHPPLRTPP